ncbi:MAG: CDP-diacylglycerol--glycerol-3-phosphate 3-phosphatidyltransferase [Candidatus Izemoplasmataceae bacterium]
MNLPNKLSFVRVFIIPVIVIIYYLDPEKLTLNLYSYLIGALFVVASITDYLDGYIARKNNLVTTFGKFIDPLADKLLVMTALLIFQELALIPMWAVLVILTREFIVTGIRLVSSGEGTVIAASKLGKYKTASTMVALTLLFFRFNDIILTTGLVIFYIGVTLTVVSGIDYFIKNKEPLLKSK